MPRVPELRESTRNLAVPAATITPRDHGAAGVFASTAGVGAGLQELATTIEVQRAQTELSEAAAAFEDDLTSVFKEASFMGVKDAVPFVRQRVSGLIKERSEGLTTGLARRKFAATAGARASELNRQFVMRAVEVDRDRMRVTTMESARKFLLSGQREKAEQVMEGAVSTGLISPSDKQKTFNAWDALQERMAIGSALTVEELREIKPQFEIELHQRRMDGFRLQEFQERANLKQQEALTFADAAVADFVFRRGHGQGSGDTEARVRVRLEEAGVPASEVERYMRARFSKLHDMLLLEDASSGDLNEGDLARMRGGQGPFRYASEEGFLRAKTVIKKTREGNKDEVSRQIGNRLRARWNNGLTGPMAVDEQWIEGILGERTPLNMVEWDRNRARLEKAFTTPLNEPLWHLIEDDVVHPEHISGLDSEIFRATQRELFELNAIRKVQILAEARARGITTEQVVSDEEAEIYYRRMILTKVDGTPLQSFFEGSEDEINSRLGRLVGELGAVGNLPKAFYDDLDDQVFRSPDLGRSLVLARILARSTSRWAESQLMRDMAQTHPELWRELHRIADMDEERLKAFRNQQAKEKLLGPEVFADIPVVRRSLFEEMRDEADARAGLPSEAFDEFNNLARQMITDNAGGDPVQALQAAKNAFRSRWVFNERYQAWQRGNIYAQTYGGASIHPEAFDDRVLSVVAAKRYGLHTLTKRQLVEHLDKHVSGRKLKAENLPVKGPLFQPDNLEHIWLSRVEGDATPSNQLLREKDGRLVWDNWREEDLATFILLSGIPMPPRSEMFKQQFDSTNPELGVAIKNYLLARSGVMTSKNRLGFPIIVREGIPLDELGGADLESVFGLKVGGNVRIDDFRKNAFHVRGVNQINVTMPPGAVAGKPSFKIVVRESESEDRQMQMSAVRWAKELPDGSVAMRDLVWNRVDGYLAWETDQVYRLKRSGGKGSFEHLQDRRKPDVRRDELPGLRAVSPF